MGLEPMTLYTRLRVLAVRRYGNWSIVSKNKHIVVGKMEIFNSDCNLTINAYYRIFSIIFNIKFFTIRKLDLIRCLKIIENKFAS